MPHKTEDDLEIPMSQLLRKNWKAGIGCLILIVIILTPIMGVPILMAITDDPNNFRLPYNVIGFQKIAYIDNQFVMYGINYEHYATDKSLVIFNISMGNVI